jgi:hypothetical protein
MTLYYRCHRCHDFVDEDDTIWVDPTTGEAHTPTWVPAEPYHPTCAPTDEKEETK